MNTLKKIEHRIMLSNLNQRDVAKQLDITYQQFNMFLKGKRKLKLKQSLILDSILGYALGTVARAELEEKIQKEIKTMKEYNPQRKLLVDKIKKSGGFWSYDTPPYGINDESLIEAALSNLEFENMDYLTNVFSISKIKKVWTEKMLPQSDRYNILNFLLAVFIFNVKRPKEYLKKYAI